MTSSAPDFESLHNALIRVCGQPDYTDSSTHAKVRILLKLASQLLKVERASAWRYNQDKSLLTCRCLYILDTDQYDSGAILSLEDYPSYFEAMSTCRVVVADDARKHPATYEFTDSYLVPLGIHAMVDTPIYSSSSHHGILCIESKDPGRQWKVEEVSFIVALADKISLAMENDAWLQATSEIYQAQRTDILTGLENRFGFQERIDDCSSCVNKSGCGQAHGLMLIGIDDLGGMNDKLGYSLVNELLQLIAERLSGLSVTNHQLFPARISPRRFALFSPNVKDNLVEVIETTLAAFSQPFELPNGSLITVPIYIGAVATSSQCGSSDNPLRKAEVALIKAKESGAGSYAIFDENWLSEYKRKKQTETELVDAINNQELLPYYQPIIDGQTERIVGLEALVRWQHPSKGVLTPYHFLPLATDIGIMPQLGQLMLESVCRDISLHQSLHSLSWISVNLSSEQLYNHSLVSLVSSLLNKFNTPKNLIELEIVEELINCDTGVVNNNLRGLDELGVKLSIDDFGTGYSSLSRLKHIPVSKIKIDRSFIDGLPDDESDCCISGSIIGMAKGLCLSVVAEGVETQAQASWLKKNNCDYIQGYFYAKPMPLEQLLSLLKSKQ